MKRFFTVTVNGQKFEVAVVEKDSTGAAVVERPQPVVSQPPAPAPAPAVPKAAAPSPKPAAASGQGKSAVSPMSGKIISILVKEGDTVDRGQPLLVLEAMKLENDIVAPEGGTVGKILVQVGQSVDTGTELVVIS